MLCGGPRRWRPSLRNAVKAYRYVSPADTRAAQQRRLQTERGKTGLQTAPASSIQLWGVPRPPPGAILEQTQAAEVAIVMEIYATA